MISPSCVPTSCNLSSQTRAFLWRTNPSSTIRDRIGCLRARPPIGLSPPDTLSPRQDPGRRAPPTTMIQDNDWKSVMPRDNRVSVRLVVGLALAILFDTIQQLVWKEGMGGIPDDASPWETINAALHEPLLGLVAILMLLRLINWLKVLELADLSYAQPITSLSYVTVTLASVV